MTSSSRACISAAVIVILCLFCAACGSEVASVSTADTPSAEAATPVPDNPDSEVAEPAAAAPAEFTNVQCVGRDVPVATATPAPMLPPPDIDGALPGGDGSGDSMESTDEIDVSQLVPTVTPTPQPDPADRAFLFAGGSPAEGDLPASTDVDRGTFRFRIGNTEYIGSGVVFDEASGPFVRAIVGSGSSYIEFNLVANEVGVDQPIRVGNRQPAVIEGGDAVDERFVVAPGPGTNTWRVDFITPAEDTDNSGGAESWVGGTIDINVCLDGTSQGQRMTGVYHLPGNGSGAPWTCDFGPNSVSDCRFG